MKTGSTVTTNFDAKGEYVICDLDDIALETDAVPQTTTVATATPIHINHTETFGEKKMSAAAPKTEMMDSENGNDDEDAPTEMIAWNERSYAAGTLCFVLSSCCVGPIFGCLLGCGTAYAAAKSPENTAIGDVARSVGDVALAARAKAMEVNEKHAIVSRTKKAASDAALSTRQATSGAWESIKNVENRHKIAERSVAAMCDAGRRAQQFDRDYRVSERTADEISQSFAYVSKRIREGYGGNAESTGSDDGSAPSVTMDEATRKSDAA